MMKKWIFISLFACFILSPLVSAEQLETEIGGLVLDRTISRFGKDFYREYFILWQEIKGTSGYNVAIIESVIPRSGTILWLEINQTRVFQTFFGRRINTTVKRSAEVAVNYSVQYLTKKSYQSDNPDMLGDGY